MFMTITGLPKHFNYHDAKAMIKQEAHVTNFILDNLVADPNGLKRVTVGLADAGDAPQLIMRLNGFQLLDNRLTVTQRGNQPLLQGAGGATHVDPYGYGAPMHANAALKGRDEMQRPYHQAPEQRVAPSLYAAAPSAAPHGYGMPAHAQLAPQGRSHDAPSYGGAPPMDRAGVPSHYARQPEPQKAPPYSASYGSDARRAPAPAAKGAPAGLLKTPANRDFMGKPERYPSDRRSPPRRYSPPRYVPDARPAASHVPAPAAPSGNYPGAYPTGGQDPYRQPAMQATPTLTSIPPWQQRSVPLAPEPYVPAPIYGVATPAPAPYESRPPVTNPDWVKGETREERGGRRRSPQRRRSYSHSPPRNRRLSPAPQRLPPWEHKRRERSPSPRRNAPPPRRSDDDWSSGAPQRRGGPDEYSGHKPQSDSPRSEFTPKPAPLLNTPAAPVSNWRDSLLPKPRVADVVARAETHSPSRPGRIHPSEDPGRYHDRPPNVGSRPLIKSNESGPFRGYRDDGPRDNSPRRSGPREMGPSAPRNVDSGPRDSGPRSFAPRGSGPNGSGPRDSGLRDGGPRDFGRGEFISGEGRPRDFGPPDGGPRDFGPRDGGPHGYKPRDGGPRDFGAPDDGPRNFRPRDDFGGSPDFGPRDFRPREAGPRDFGPPDGGDFDPREFAEFRTHDSGPRDFRPRDSGPRDFGPSDGGPQDFGFRGDGPHGFGPRDDGPRGFGPREDGPRGFGPRDDGPRGGSRDRFAPERPPHVAPYKRPDRPPLEQFERPPFHPEGREPHPGANDPDWSLQQQELEIRDLVVAKLSQQITSRQQPDLLHNEMFLKDIQKLLMDRVDSIFGSRCGHKFGQIMSGYRKLYPVSTDRDLVDELLHPAGKKRSAEGSSGPPAKQRASRDISNLEAQQKAASAWLAAEAKKPGPGPGSNVMINKHPHGNKKIRAEAKRVIRSEFSGELKYELPPAQKKALDAELDTIKKLMLEGLPESAPTPAEKAVVEALKGKGGAEILRVLELHATKRLLDISISLHVRILCTPRPPNMTALRTFLAQYHATALQKSERSKTLMATLPSYYEFDRLCALGTVTIDNSNVTFKPFQVTGPTKIPLRSKGRTKGNSGGAEATQLSPTAIDLGGRSGSDSDMEEGSEEEGDDIMDDELEDY